MPRIVNIAAETAFSFITNIFNNIFKTNVDAAFSPLQTKWAA